MLLLPAPPLPTPLARPQRGKERSRLVHKPSLRGKGARLCSLPVPPRAFAAALQQSAARWPGFLHISQGPAPGLCLPPPFAVALGAASFCLLASAEAISALIFEILFRSHFARSHGWIWPPAVIVATAAAQVA